MRTLEDRLIQAADEAKLQVSQIDTRSATSIRTRQQHRRAFVSTLAITAMFIVFGVSALVLSRDAGQDTASDPSTPSTTAALVEETETPATTTTVVPSPEIFQSPGPDTQEREFYDIQEQEFYEEFYWDLLIANATSNDGAVVELRGQLLNVYDNVLNSVGALPLEYSSGRNSPGVHEAAMFLYRSGSSTVLLKVQWQEWDGRSESNPLGFPATSVREQWGGDSVFIDIKPDLGAFGAVNTGSLKTVRFLPLTMAAEGTMPFTIPETEMQEIARTVFEVLAP